MVKWRESFIRSSSFPSERLATRNRYFFFKIEMRKYVMYNHRNKVSVCHMAVAIYEFLPTPQLIIIIIRVFMIFKVEAE